MSVMPKILWEAQPRQRMLISCPCFEVFFGGARGGGKTDASLGDWMEHSATYGKAAVGLFLRRELTQLTEVMARARELFEPIGATWNEAKKTLTMPNAARLKFAYLDNDADAEKYQGHNYTRIYIEEVTNFPSPAPIDLLRATLRSASGVPVGMRLTGNPGGAGHNWVKARYIDPHPAGGKVIWEEDEIEINGVLTKIRLSRVFIPSKLGDNQKLLMSDPTYVLRLKQAGSEALVKAWLDGNWDLIDGAYFDEFTPSLHIISRDYKAAIPKSALIFGAFDWGSAKPFSMGWYAVSDGTWGLPRGALFKFAEWYGRIPNKHNVGLKLNADEVARGITQREREMMIQPQYRVADPAIFIQNGGKSIGATMSEVGCSFIRADNKRLSGWQEVHRRLKGITDANGNIVTPMLYISEDCKDTIRTVPVLQHDKTNIEDVDTEGEDHAGDELRYACNSHIWVKDAEASAFSGGQMNVQGLTFQQAMKWAKQVRQRGNTFYG